jgi:hypothetical protein
MIDEGRLIRTFIRLELRISRLLTLIETFRNNHRCKTQISTCDATTPIESVGCGLHWEKNLKNPYRNCKPEAEMEVLSIEPSGQQFW